MVAVRREIFEIGAQEKGEEFFVAVIPRTPDWICAVIHPAERRFALDEKSVFIAQVQKLLGGWIMAGADVVHISRAEKLGVFLPNIRRQAATAHRANLVPASAAQ